MRHAMRHVARHAMPHAMRQILLASFLLSAMPAIAHDLWLERAADGVTLYQGHKHSTHGGAETIAYDANFVKEASCLTADGRIEPLALTQSAPWRAAAADCAAIRVAASSGYWTKTPWDTKNAPKTGVSGVIKSWLSEESVKHIDRWTSGAGQPMSAGLEITPTADPFALKPGDKLVVLVTENRQPKADVPVAYGDDVRGATGADGRISIRLRHEGVQLIHTSMETPLADGKADTLVRAAILQFEIAK
jgi:nickel transport protein